jgi:fibronectin type 3 domain-containing protein
VKLSWSKISGAKKYVVYRKAGSATSWTKIATITTNSYVDKNVKAGTKYTYTVKAYNGSFYSAYDTNGDTIYFLKTPSVSSATSSKTGITVKWGKVSGASGYIVERKTGSGEYERLTKFSGGTKVSYVDKTAEKGKTYTYRVYAYKSSSKSAASNTVSCKDKY